VRDNRFDYEAHEGRMQTGGRTVYAGSKLKPPTTRAGAAWKTSLAVWGKPAVRNDRGDRGNVGIIRSPVRASILPDSHYRSFACFLGSSWSVLPLTSWLAHGFSVDRLVQITKIA
jgi:hypothetical protein